MLGALHRRRAGLGGPKLDARPTSDQKVAGSTHAAQQHITKTCLFKYIEILPPKNEKKKKQKKKTDIFHISAQNIDCWYSLEPPHRGGSNEYPQSLEPPHRGGSNEYPQSMI